MNERNITKHPYLSLHVNIHVHSEIAAISTQLQHSTTTKGTE